MLDGTNFYGRHNIQHPQGYENAETLMLLTTMLVLHALQEVRFIISSSKTSIQHHEFKFLGVTINTNSNYSIITDNRVQAIAQ